MIKLIQQASKLPIKGMLRPQALIFFILLSPIERKTLLRVREKRKEKFQEKYREREREGGFAQGKEEEKAYKFKTFFQA